MVVGLREMPHSNKYRSDKQRQSALVRSDQDCAPFLT